MAEKNFQVRSYVTYWLDAVDEHSLHSPFFFDFYTNVLKAPVQPHNTAENLRNQLLTDQRVVNMNDLGSGEHTSRIIANIAATSLSPRKFSALYTRVIRHYDLHTVVELGTSLGINTVYLASAPATQVTTFEGSQEIASLATLTFEFAGAVNIRLVQGDIAATLPAYLQTVRKVDFILMDANHRYEPTRRYFELLVPKIHERTVVVMDDIHYSAEMNRAWNEIRKHELVYASADLYRCGLLFFDPSLNKQHVILQF